MVWWSQCQAKPDEGREPMGKRYEGKVGDSRAKIDEGGDRIDALYNFRGGNDKDHLVTNDGVNASYLREDGEVIVDDLLP